MDYEKKYKETLERAKSIKDSIIASHNKESVSYYTGFINNIFPELKESEDERIRKEIINFLECYKREAPSRKDKLGDWITWLEKQKEQKPAEQLGGTFTSYDIAKKTFTDGQNYVIAHPEKFGLCKPAEWSEEDVEKLAKNRMSKSGTLKSEMSFYRQGVRDAFNYKGMRSHWKPSEYQMKALYSLVFDGGITYVSQLSYLKSLYEDLKSL